MDEIDREQFAPRAGQPPKPKGSLLPVLIVLGSGLAVVMGMFMFAGRAGLLMVAAVAAVLALPLLHYLTWGWWLSKAIRREEHARRSGDDDSPND